MEEDLLPKIGKKISFNGLMKKIKISQEKVLKKSKRIKGGKKGDMRIAAAEWVDEELIDNIKIRGKLSRRWRIARKKYEPQEILNNYEKEYKFQQIKTSNMAGDKKGEWEKRKIIETKRDGKKFWNLIKDLLGKNRKREEDAYVYTEDGIKNNINEISEEYIKEWKQEIYQKTERVDLTFWYGGENCIGKKKEMEEEEKQENNEIMKEPKMTEKELVNIVNGQKNGKAAGVDGVRAELLKSLIKTAPSKNIY